MKLQVIQLFLSIAETGSFASAARQQHVSQPSVSMTIAALEEQLGCPLFIRTKGQHSRLPLTREGEIFREYAEQYLDSYSRLLIALAQKQSFPPFVMASSPTPGSTLLPPLMQAFHKDYPSIHCTVQSHPGRELLSRLLHREYELFITGMPVQGPDIVAEPFFYDPMELICPASMNLGSTITLKQLQKLPLITRNEKCSTTQRLIAALDQLGVPLSEMNITLQVYGNSDVLQAVAMGSGVGFITRSLLATSSEQRQKVTTVAVKRLKIDRNLHLVKLRSEGLSPGGQIFWDYARELRWRKNTFVYNTLPLP